MTGLLAVVSAGFDPIAYLCASDMPRCLLALALTAPTFARVQTGEPVTAGLLTDNLRFRVGSTEYLGSMATS
jgi:hypothetical protein